MLNNNRRVRHPRVILFLGTSSQPETKDLIIIFEFMDNGSLFDMLSSKRKKSLHFPKDGNLLRVGLDISLGRNN